MNFILLKLTIYTKVLLVKILTYIQLYLVSMFVLPYEDDDVATSTAESEIDRTALVRK